MRLRFAALAACCVFLASPACSTRLGDHCVVDSDCPTGTTCRGDACVAGAVAPSGEGEGASTGEGEGASTGEGEGASTGEGEGEGEGGLPNGEGEGEGASSGEGEGEGEGGEGEGAGEGEGGGNPTGTCGDGVLASGEDCDDGNTVSGDGCSSLCHVEPTFFCPNGPGKPCLLKFNYVPSHAADPNGAALAGVLPIGDLELSGICHASVDTTSAVSSICGTTVATTLFTTTGNEQDIRVFFVGNFTMDSGSTLTFTGNHPVLLLVYGNASVNGIIDVSANGGSPGPGARSDPACTSNGALGTDVTGTVGAGGGGILLTSRGGDGGKSGQTAGGRGGRPTAALSPTGTSFVGGCAGGSAPNASGGAGGGAIEIAVAGSWAPSLTSAIRASGGFGATANGGGGAGGGSGGTILLEGSGASIATGFARGGNGGGGGGLPASVGSADPSVEGANGGDNAALAAGGGGAGGCGLVQTD